MLVGNPQQTSKHFYAVGDRAAEKYHNTYARKSGVAPERVRYKCRAVVLDLEMHPPYERRDGGGTED